MVVKLKRSWKSCLFQTLAPQRKDLSDPRPSSSSPLCRGINSHYRFLFSCRPLLFGPGEAVLSSALSSPCLVIQPYQEARNVLTLKNGHTAFWGRDGVGGSSLPHPLTGRRCPAGPGDGAVGVPPPWPRNLPSSLQPAGRGAGAGFCLLFSVSQSSRSSSLRQYFCHQLFDGERTQRRVTSSYQYVCAFPNLSPPRSAPHPGRVCNAQGSPFIQGPIQRLRHFHSARPHLPKPTPYFLPINHVPSHG